MLRTDVNEYGTLALAVSSGHMDIAKMLIRYGSDVNAKDNDGYTLKLTLSGRSVSLHYISNFFCQVLCLLTASS